MLKTTYRALIYDADEICQDIADDYRTEKEAIAFARKNIAPSGYIEVERVDVRALLRISRSAEIVTTPIK